MPSSAAVPNVRSDTFLCGEPVVPPQEANMLLHADQPILMCPGKKAKYECNAGGINVRYVRIFKLDISIQILISYLIFIGQTYNRYL